MASSMDWTLYDVFVHMIKTSYEVFGRLRFTRKFRKVRGTWRTLVLVLFWILSKVGASTATGLPQGMYFYHQRQSFPVAAACSGVKLFCCEVRLHGFAQMKLEGVEWARTGKLACGIAEWGSWHMHSHNKSLGGNIHSFHVRYGSASCGFIKPNLRCSVVRYGDKIRLYEPRQSSLA